VGGSVSKERVRAFDASSRTGGMVRHRIISMTRMKHLQCHYHRIMRRTRSPMGREQLQIRRIIRSNCGGPQLDQTTKLHLAVVRDSTGSALQLTMFSLELRQILSSILGASVIDATTQGTSHDPSDLCIVRHIHRCPYGCRPAQMAHHAQHVSKWPGK